LIISVLQDYGRCIIIVPESHFCEEVTTLWLAKKTENGTGRRPDGNTACIPIQFNNGVCLDEM